MFFLKNKNNFYSRNYNHSNENIDFSQIPINGKINILGIGDQKKFFTDNFVNFIKIYSSIFFSALAYGIAMVLIAIKLENNVKDDILITFSTVIQISAGIIFANFLPRLSNKIGIINNVFYASLTSAIATLCLNKFVSYQIWILIIFIMGISLFISNVSRNTIMIDFSEDKNRAFCISLGSLIVAIGNSLGPVLINFLNFKNNIWLFALSAFIHLLSGIIIKTLKNSQINLRQQKRISPWRYILHSPKIMLSGFSYSFVMSSCSAFAIIFGLRIGMSENSAGLLLSCLLIGTVSFLPISYLCNHFNLRFLMILFSSMSLFMINKIFYLNEYSHLHWYFFILFSCLAGMKLPTLVLINEKYKASQRLAVNSSFAKVTLTGSISGLLWSGLMFKFFNYNGLWISTGGMLIIFLAFCFFNYFYKFIQNKLSLKDLNIFKKKFEPIEL